MKKTDKQIVNLLCGASTKNKVLLAIVYACVLIMAGCIWLLWNLHRGVPITLLFFAMVCILLFFYATVLFVSSGKHVKELKEKYAHLSEEEKAEVRELAEHFDGKGLGFSEHYIYGFMARVSDYKKAKDTIVFEYLPIDQISFIDTLNSKEQEEKARDFQRKTQAALMSAGAAYVRASRQYRSGIVANSYNSPLGLENTTNVSNYICIELKNGSKYRAIGDTAFLEKVKSRVEE